MFVKLVLDLTAEDFTNDRELVRWLWNDSGKYAFWGTMLICVICFDVTVVHL